MEGVKAAHTIHACYRVVRDQKLEEKMQGIYFKIVEPMLISTGIMSIHLPGNRKHSLFASCHSYPDSRVEEFHYDSE